MPRAGTRSASSDPDADLAWVVPASLRADLAGPYGQLLRGADADRALRALTTFATCGDRVTARAVELGHLPLIGIVDYKTQRSEPIDPRSFAPLAARRTLRVRNPAGMLTERLRRAVRTLVHEGGGLIEVDGEEDLGALALVETLPAGATVIYGIPGAGASFVRVDADAKEHVQELIARMERRKVDLGD